MYAIEEELLSLNKTIFSSGVASAHVFKTVFSQPWTSSEQAWTNLLFNNGTINLLNSYKAKPTSSFGFALK